MILPMAAGLFLMWVNHRRIERVEYVSALPGRAEFLDVIEAVSPTGYAHAQRELIVPERDEASFEWIAQTQQMLAKGEWRVRHVDYDNAPLGREVTAASPYRWWLGLVAWIDHLCSGRPMGLAVEHAALYADPVLHGLMLAGITILVAWRFGIFAAVLFSVGFATIFPFAAGFLPGAPDHHGLARMVGLGSILLFLVGLGQGRPGNHWFALAGVAGGFGLWLDVAIQVPLLAGVILGGLMSAWLVRRNPDQTPAWALSGRSWRIWSVSGVITVLAAYLLEYFPAHLGGWQLESIHPLYAFAWLGAGELLARITGWAAQKKTPWKLFDGLVGLLAGAAIVAVPLAMKWSGSRGYLARDLLSLRLTNQPGGIVAANSWGWLTREGMTATAWATLLPLVVLVPVGWFIFSPARKLELRTSLAFALGPVLVAFGFAGQQLAWWSLLDATVLVLMVAAAAEREQPQPRTSLWIWATAVALFALPGIWQLVPRGPVNSTMTLTAAETEELVERHLAHWLARHAEAGGTVVFAPPHQALTLGFYGGLRAIGTFSPDNPAGFGATLMIAGANTLEEARALIQARNVRYVVIPSWDPFFAEFGRLYLAKQFSNRESVLVYELRRFNLPLWLRPVAYPMPAITGFEKQSVLVFEVVDEQSPAAAAGRLAEYLIETGELDQAVTVGEALRRFPSDVGALTARAQVSSARDDPAGLAQALDLLLARLSSGADRYLPWDRRVSLAVVLARADRIDLAREQARRCLSELDEKKLRSLSVGALFQLQVLSREFKLEVVDPRLRALALDLLPAELRDRL